MIDIKIHAIRADGKLFVDTLTSTQIWVLVVQLYN